MCWSRNIDQVWLHSVSHPPSSDVAHICSATLCAPTEIAHTVLASAHKTKNVCMRLQASPTCLCHCQEEEERSI